MNPRLVRRMAAIAVWLAPLGAAFVSQPAAAQHYQYRTVQPETGQISNMSLNSDRGLQPGATLRLQVYATPGARWANVILGEGGVRVRLAEQRPGEYLGTHLIERGERIDPSGLMTVRAGWGEGPVAVSFNFPPAFQALARATPPAPEVESFSMSPRNNLDTGDVLRFRVEGTPGVQATLNVPGVVRGLPLREVRPGVYVGRYTIRADDDLDAFDDARVVLRRGNQRTAVRVGEAQEQYGYGYGR